MLNGYTGQFLPVELLLLEQFAKKSLCPAVPQLQVSIGSCIGSLGTWEKERASDQVRTLKVANNRAFLSIYKIYIALLQGNPAHLVLDHLITGKKFYIWKHKIPINSSSIKWLPNYLMNTKDVCIANSKPGT